MDILVEFARPYSLFDLIELEEKFSDALRCKVDLVTEKALHPSVKKFIERDVQYFD